MRRLIALLLCTFAFSVLFGACKAQTPADTTPPAQETQSAGDQVKITLWVPDETASYLVQLETSVSDTPQGLIDALREQSVLPEQTKVLDFRIEQGDKKTQEGFLDLSEEFGTAMADTGTAGELMTMSSLVNTFLARYELDSLMVTVQGEIIETGHAIYDRPQTWYEFEENYTFRDGLTQEDVAETESMARGYYESGTSFELLSLRLADDELYSAYFDASGCAAYLPGQIAIYEAETSHAGAGIYRHIVFLKSVTEGTWTQVEEGY